MALPFLGVLRQNRVARACAIAIFCYGVAGAAVSPYLPVVAIRELGMSNQGYSVLIFAAAVANVLAAIGLGLIGDRSGRYRGPIALATACGVAGLAAFWARPSPVMLAVTAIGPVAFYHAAGSMIFAKMKRHEAELSRQEAEEAGALLRMMISLAWVLVPGAVGLALAASPTMLPAFLIAAAAAALGLIAILLILPGDPPQSRAARPGPAFSVTPGLLGRVLAVALVSSVLHVNAAVLPLIVTGRAGGRVADVGLIAGYVALLEVVFIFIWARIGRVLTLGSALAIAMALYLLYLVGIAGARGMTQVYLASIIGGIAAAAIISLPIPLLLNLIEGKPGLSASLMAITQFTAAGIGAGVFAAGTAIGGYPAAAVGGGIAGLAGGLALLGFGGWRFARTAAG